RVVFGRLLEDGGEGAAWPAPGRPKVEEDNSALLNRLSEVFRGDLHGAAHGHLRGGELGALCNSSQAADRAALPSRRSASWEVAMTHCVSKDTGRYSLGPWHERA